MIKMIKDKVFITVGDGVPLGDFISGCHLIKCFECGRTYFLNGSDLTIMHGYGYNTVPKDSRGINKIVLCVVCHDAVEKRLKSLRRLKT